MGCRTRVNDSDSDSGGLRDLTLSACPEFVVLGLNGQLSTFDTRTLQFTDIAPLACRPRSGWPLSFDVARDGTAWVFYSDDELFRVDPTTGACQPVAFNASTLPDNRSFFLGAAFSPDGPGAATETLFITPAHELPAFVNDMSLPGTSSHTTLFAVDLEAHTATRVAEVDGAYQLAGTPEGELWAFYIHSMSRLDKRTGARDREIQLLPFGLGYVGPAWGPSSDVVATADSFWYFVEIVTFPDAGERRQQQVWRIDRATGARNTVIEDTGRRIVGAALDDCGGSP